MIGFLGIDVGSVSTNLVYINEDGKVRESIYLRTNGRPIAALQRGLQEMTELLPPKTVIRGVGATGSGRHLAGIIAGADVVKNEITSHAVAASRVVPGVRTVLEIGGQDSKIIILRDGIVADFAMNTVCAAGTGSFLDQQAARLNIPIEKFGDLSLKSSSPVRIAGRCAVFAESDMIHKQQMGYDMPDILAGLCEALVRNYLNNVGKGKDISGTVVFQGGVAANQGMKAAFERALNIEVIIPPHFGVMGAVGASMLARDHVARGVPTRFKGFGAAESDFRAGSFECDGCPNMCEVVEIRKDGSVIARWGDRCGKWSTRMDRRKISS
ncbi:MAG: 2-hydroxyglutaryl-CoA dehydratase [Peptococcaceae bacterium BRH_c4a]|nr:MAG: 2-hydroxyglutaryl-CoA dehydratase [Peptococcaceae bacterium BRH_c4a]